MSCKTCETFGCGSGYLDHHEAGCRRCDCKVSHNALVDYEVNTGSGLKSFDTRRGKRRPNWLQRKLVKHKRIANAFDEFSIIWLSITTTIVGFGAGILATTPAVPGWVTFVLGFVYAPYFSYQLQKVSEAVMLRKVRDEIDKLKVELFG